MVVKVGVLIPSISLGGASKVALNQVKYLKKHGYKAKLLTLAPVKVVKVDHSCVGLGKFLPVMKTSASVLVNIAWGVRIKKVDVDAIVAHGIASILALKFKEKYNIRYINYIHHPASFLHGKPIHEREEESILGPLAKYPLKLLWSKSKLAAEDIRSIKAAEYNFANSKRTLNYLLKIYGNIKADVCYPAIDDEFHAIIPRLEDKRNYILYASRHVEQKGFHLLPKIFSKINKNVKLILAGKPTSLTGKVLSEFKELNLANRVILKINVSDQELIELYKKSKILLFPAIKEDFGLSPLECMATGCIPVSWNDSGGVEEIIQDGKTGLLAKPYDVDDYAAKVNMLLEDNELYAHILNEAKKISLKFSWDNHVRKIGEVIYAIIANW
jgi:glycosyltransferase involved in cell wall biosynthesis